MRRLTAVALLGVACASPGMPPGGPTDVAAPQIVAIAPDSGRTGITPKEVIFRFDEIVSERPPAVTTLADLFLISPRDGAPNVSWHRDEIAVRPPHGWRPNTAYTVIMQRGLSDIRGNVRNTGASTFFSTGSNIPRTRITGHVFDWVSGAPANGALIESFVRPDTIHAYIALADSAGAFSLERMPPGHYTIRSFVDRNKNQGIDPSEPWDSVSVNLTDSVVSELLVFVHDTLPPRIRDVAAFDSVSLKVTFDKAVDPGQTLSAANFAVLGPDSVAIPIVSAGAAPVDTLKRLPIFPRPAVAPALGRSRVPTRPDTTSVVRAVMSRPVLISDAVIKLQHALPPKTAYRVRAIGIRGLLGQSGDSERRYTSPAPPPPRAPTQPGAKPPGTPTGTPVTPPPATPPPATLPPACP